MPCALSWPQDHESLTAQQVAFFSAGQSFVKCTGEQLLGVFIEEQNPSVWLLPILSVQRSPQGVKSISLPGLCLLASQSAEW